MAARCASCNYPLTISDSVVCYECTSYFHIDCAQLVGFPFYPQRNTFHCSTCKLLPLPQRADSDSDGDSDGGTMPSRQLDYNIEDRSDITNDMNEVKGSVQDLSSLCKEMLREINELKSINLTLRCSVENLRHDSSRRDTVIADLHRRIEALEKNINGPKYSLESADWNLDSVVLEKEQELERYSSPEPSDVTNARESARVSSPVNVIYPNEAMAVEKGNITKYTEYNNFPEGDHEIPVAKTEYNASFSERESKNLNQPSTQDWTWKGNDAIEIKSADGSNQSKYNYTDEDQKEGVCEDNEEWENEQEAKYAVQRQKRSVQRDSEELKIQENYYEDEEDDEESEDEKTQYEIDEMKLLKDREEVRTELGSDVESIATLDERELSERLLGEGLTAIDESSPGDDQPEDQESRLAEDTSHGDDWSPTDGDVDKGIDRVVGQDNETECRFLEEELHQEDEGHRDMEPTDLVDGEAEPVGGDHPAAQAGEDEATLPSEAGVEIVEPPIEPQHTESDLWDYLKDTVSSVHPSTVEEFLENLIGTLQHVPEEYFKPVIDANIRRATSPSVTDGEHLQSQDGTHELDKATDSILENSNLAEELHQEQCGETSPTDLAVDDGYTPIEVSD